jgi:hypothetical protein
MLNDVRMPGNSVGELSVPPKGVEAVVTQCAAWSARGIELQALATLHARQIPTPSAAHFLKSPLNEHFRTDRDIRPVRKLYFAALPSSTKISAQLVQRAASR